jgi:hypothetical protein
MVLGRRAMGVKWGLGNSRSKIEEWRFCTGYSEFMQECEGLKVNVHFWLN